MDSLQPFMFDADLFIGHFLTTIFLSVYFISAQTKHLNIYF